MVEGKGKRNCRLRSKLAFLFTINSESNKRQSQTRALRNENKTLTKLLTKCVKKPAAAQHKTTEAPSTTTKTKKKFTESFMYCTSVKLCASMLTAQHGYMEMASNMHNSRPGIMKTAANKSWNGNGNNALLIPSDVTH